MPFRSVWDHALTFEAVIAGAVTVVVLALTGFAVVRYRAKARDRASQNTEHKPVEIAYAVLLLAAAIAIIVVTRADNSDDGFAATAQTADPAGGGVHIRVTGFQWCWRFSYAPPGGSTTGTRAVTVQANCLNGQTPTMVVPTGTPVTVSTTSDDVIHSWWVPELRYKLDAFPDHLNNVTTRFTQTGRWLGHCAEFCGERHAYMTFWLRVVTPAQFHRWLAAQAARQAAGPA